MTKKEAFSKEKNNVEPVENFKKGPSNPKNQKT